MNKSKIKPLCLFMLALAYTGFSFVGCATAPDTARYPKEPLLMGQSPKTLAILPFENNSVTDPERFSPLSKGLCAMLITDLENNKSTLKLIERSKIESLLKEIALGQSGSVDPATAVKVGKILGAQSIAFGSFMVLGDSVRMDVRIIEVETSKLIISKSITGSSNDFMFLEGKLAKKIADALHVALLPMTAAGEKNMNAVLFFSRGLEALDQGHTTQAKKLFQKSIDLDPAFKAQIDNLKGLNE